MIVDYKVKTHREAAKEKRMIMMSVMLLPHTMQCRPLYFLISCNKTKCLAFVDGGTK